MKIARIENNVVVEILPEETYKLGISYWYGKDFADQCVDAPDNVKQGWVYDVLKKTFSEPLPEVPEPYMPSLEERVASAESALNVLMGVV